MSFGLEFLSLVIKLMLRGGVIDGEK